MRVLFEKTLPEYQHTFNVNFEQQFGSAADESTELEYIWRSRKEITEHISIGFEAYGSLGGLKTLHHYKSKSISSGLQYIMNSMLAPLK